MTPRVLALRALGLGDLLTAVPALRGLRHTFPEHDVVLATDPTLGPLVRLAGLADALLPTQGLRPLAWSVPPPDVAVNLHGRGPQSHRLLQQLQAGTVLAYGNDAAGHPGPQWCDTEHEVRRWCRLLEEYDVPADPARLDLPTPKRPALRPGSTIIHPGAGRPDKRWGADKYAAVASQLAAAGHPVVITGSRAERRLAADVARRAGLPTSAVLAGGLDLVDLAALVATSRLLVCGDTGIAHLASAYSTPSVVLFGREHPDQWGPPPRSYHVALRDASGDLAALSVSAVLAAISRLSAAGHLGVRSSG